MPTLHLMYSPNRETLERISELKSNDDGILLLGDGCFLANNSYQPRQFMMRQKDADIRGINPELSTLRLISEEEWVAMTLTFDKTMSWF